MRTDCHVPITLRISGVPSDDQLAALGRTLTRAVAARLAEAERLLADRHGVGGSAAAEVRESYDPRRDGAGGYAVPSYSDDGDPVAVPKRPAAKASPKTPKTPTAPKKPRIADLIKRARDPRVAAELLDRYAALGDKELKNRAAKGEGGAQSALDARTPSNKADLAEVADSNFRPPHEATVMIFRRGVKIDERNLNSWNMTAEEKALGFPASTDAAHTEARAVRPDPLRGDFLRRGDVMLIAGQYDPCRACRTAMQEAATRTGATIQYIWMGGQQSFRPAAAGGVAGAAATVEGGKEATPREVSLRTEPGTAEPGRAPAEPAEFGPSVPVRPTPPKPPTSRFSTGQRVTAGAAMAIVAVNEFLSYINRARDAAQRNIDLGEAEFRFWEWAGAKPVRRVWDSWSQAPLPEGSSPSASAAGSSSWWYVADIDVDALRDSLHRKVRSYQDFLLFIDSAAQLDTIALVPAIPDHPDAAQRALAEHVHYYAKVNKEDRTKTKLLDITDVLAPIRASALTQLDAIMRIKAAALSAGEQHQVFRLGHGAETTIYRAAHKSFRGEQVILNSQRLFGPDPWVRVVGPDVDVGGRFSTDVRVRVTPANADAERAALVSAYWVFHDLDDTLAEVRRAGRPILSREPAEGPVIDSFVAGPLPGDPRFGITRYHRHADPDVSNTAAIGELNEFWVERDALVAISAEEVERYSHSR
jgi:hypothetical protein